MGGIGRVGGLGVLEKVGYFVLLLGCGNWWIMSILLLSLVLLGKLLGMSGRCIALSAAVVDRRGRRWRWILLLLTIRCW